MPQTRRRQVVTRTIAGLLAVLGVWAFAYDPSLFVWSIGSSWTLRLGVPFLLAAFAAYALVGERPAYRILRSLGQVLQLPQNALDKVLERVIEQPPEFPEQADRPEARIPSTTSETKLAAPQERPPSPDQRPPS